jgi:hypothetical protein
MSRCPIPARARSAPSEQTMYNDKVAESGTGLQTYPNKVKKWSLAAEAHFEDLDRSIPIP